MTIHQIIKMLRDAGFLVSIVSILSGSIVVYLQNRSVSSSEVIAVIGEGYTVFQGGHGSVVVVCQQ